MINDAKMTYLDESECQFEKQQKIYQYNEKIPKAVLSLSIILCVMCLFIGIIIFIYRKSKIIKSASPSFLYYILFSLILLSLTGNVFSYRPSEEYICAFRVWFTSVSMTLLLSVIFCKAWRIHKLFNNRELQRVKVTNLTLLRMIGMFLLAQIVLLGIWWGIKRSKSILVFSSEESSYLSDVYVYECTSEWYFVIIECVFIAAICFWGARVSWSIRKASTQFNEALPLFSTTIFICIIIIYYSNNRNYFSST